MQRWWFLVEHLHEDREGHADFEKAYSQTAKRESNTDFSSQSLADAESHSEKTSLRSLSFLCERSIFASFCTGNLCPLKLTTNQQTELRLSRIL